MIALCLLISIWFLALLIRLVSLFRLTIPLGYAVVVSLCFGEWYHAHEVLGDGIFFALLGVVAFSWIASIVRKIREWA
mgnify:CR=1 FL=1